jgi:hypothetical protein
MTPACSFAVSRTHVVTILEVIDLAEGDLMKYPSISLRAIAADPEGASKIIDPLKWMEIKRPAQFLRSFHLRTRSHGTSMSAWPRHQMFSPMVVSSALCQEFVPRAKIQLGETMLANGGVDQSNFRDYLY